MTQPDLGLQDVSISSIQEQLERLLSWPSFQNSRRYPKFLKYIVEKAISTSCDELKERVIGVAVFERPADYEPATDPVVRLVASETRKRLAQYYLRADHENELRIEIPPGSYLPVFYWPRPRDTKPSTSDGENRTASQTADRLVNAGAGAGFAAARRQSVSQGRQSNRARLLVVALLTLIITTVLAARLWWVRTGPERHLRAFWEPMLAANPSMLICIGDWPSTSTGQTGRRYVGPYDLMALARLAGMLSGTKHQFSIQMASDVTLTDLRVKPGILIGFSNNKWTPVILTDARYQLRIAPDTNRNFLLDTQSPVGQNPAIDVILAPTGAAMGREAGLISRIASPTTGQVELVIAGSGADGTVAASEFVTNPDYFRQFADHAPGGWEHRNVQIVVSTNVINGRSGPPHMVLFSVY